MDFVWAATVMNGGIARQPLPPAVTGRAIELRHRALDSAEFVVTAV